MNIKSLFFTVALGAGLIPLQMSAATETTVHFVKVSDLSERFELGKPAYLTFTAAEGGGGVVGSLREDSDGFAVVEYINKITGETSCCQVGKDNLLTLSRTIRTDFTCLPVSQTPISVVTGAGDLIIGCKSQVGSCRSRVLQIPGPSKRILQAHRDGSPNTDPFFEFGKAPLKACKTLEEGLALAKKVNGLTEAERPARERKLTEALYPIIKRVVRIDDTGEVSIKELKAGK